MKNCGRWAWLAAGLVLGVAGAVVFLGGQRTAQAANDRFEDYIMCTGAVAVRPGAPTDGVWVLDYKAGKLLGTVIDRTSGKILGWAEVDLVQEFGIQPRQHVHFMMTTGNIAAGQAALYVAELTTGKLGVYTMRQPPGGRAGFTIARHDMVLFRQPPPNPNP
jgi:hypothetical protein